VLHPSRLQYVALFLLVTMVSTLVARRALKQRKRDIVIEDMHHSFAALPLALTSPLDALSPNEPIPIFSGELALNCDSRTLYGSGDVSFLWLPRPRVVFRGVFSGPSRVDIMECHTLCVERYEPTEALIANACCKSSSSSTEVNGILNETLRPKLPGGELGEIRFLLTNFSSYFGEPVRFSGKPLAMARSRWRLSIEGYEIAIDLKERHKELEDNLKANGGFGITNIGRVSKADGMLLNMEDYETLSLLPRAL
jgi:hypothetical protein